MINKLKEKYNRGFTPIFWGSKKRGFTLVETLIAVFLLAVAIAGPLTVASRAFIASVVAKDQVVAYYLAQDALEYIRFRRDSNCLASGTAAPCQPGTSGNQWLSGLSDCINGVTGECRVDSFASTVAACEKDDSDCILNFDSDPNIKRFNYDTVGGTNVPSKFKRYVRIGFAVSNPNEALVTVTVSWPTTSLNSTSQGITGGSGAASCDAGTRCIILKETIFNWQ